MLRSYTDSVFVEASMAQINEHHRITDSATQQSIFKVAAQRTGYRGPLRYRPDDWRLAYNRGR